jgi:hypothetical protein
VVELGEDHRALSHAILVEKDVDKRKAIEGVQAEEEVGRRERERKLGRWWRMVGLWGKRGRDGPE